jgi:hypothetical protein
MPELLDDAGDSLSSALWVLSWAVQEATPNIPAVGAQPTSPLLKQARVGSKQVSTDKSRSVDSGMATTSCLLTFQHVVYCGMFQV